MSSALVNMGLLGPVSLGLFLFVAVTAARIASPPPSSTNRSIDEQLGETDGHSFAPYNHSEIAGRTKHRGHCPRNCSHRTMRKSQMRTKQSGQTNAFVKKHSEDADRSHGMWSNLMRTVDMLWNTVGKLLQRDATDDDIEKY
ncbi:hypothetical protein EG68_01698 [Paragonimus skrjabini miyazakii]|uniref:Uncharacterized protein n=1 Tax=Paragonimus skrjabini miyazakii TaxID=59628 RepID=A0A8S9ZAS8_9TREM|nr:hypothetical protein EG68_01698 [Paragonimus skrjabini miyazakii]